jgi:spore coat protein U-like protein
MFSNSIRKCAQLTLGAAALSLMVGGPAFAASVGATLGVSANVTADCTIAAAPSLLVSTYNPLIGAVAATATLAVTCTQGTVATIGLDTGANAVSAVGTTRAMTDGTDFLMYDLYTSSAHSTIWGNGAGTAVIEAAAPSAATIDYTVYGLVPGAQDVPTGTYNDSVAVTVSF